MRKNIINVIILILAVIIVGVLIYTNKQQGKQPEENGSTDSLSGNEPEVAVNTNAIATNSTVVLNGTVNPNGANTTFWYKYGESPNLNSDSNEYSIGSGFSSIDAPSYISSLNPNTTYRYQLIAKNKYGEVESEIYSFKTTDQAPLPPGSEPTAATSDALDVTRTTAKLRGTVNAKGWETTYWFEYGETDELGLVTDFKSGGNINEDDSASGFLQNLKPVTKYYFRLNAQNQYGTVNGEIYNFTTTGPVTPLQPNVYKNNPSNITSTSATLRGAINPNAAKTTYWFEYGYGESLGTIVAKNTSVRVLSDGTEKVYVSADVVGLNIDTNYMYRIVVKNEIGTTYGDIVYFRTLK